MQPSNFGLIAHLILLLPPRESQAGRRLIIAL